MCYKQYNSFGELFVGADEGESPPLKSMYPPPTKKIWGGGKMIGGLKILHEILPPPLNQRGGGHFAVFVRLKRGRVQLALRIEIEA